MGHFQPADIRAHHDQIGQILCLQVLVHYRRGIEVIHGNVEKTLDLLRVQIHGQNPVCTRRHQQVRDQLGRNRHPRLILAILAGVAVKRNYRRDAPRTGPAQRIDHDE